MKDPLEKIFKPFAEYAPTILRIGLGIMFVFYGFGKFQNLAGTTAFFTSLHIPMPGLNAPFVATVELLGGLLLIMGALTRIAAFFTSCVLAVALITVHLPAIMAGTAIGDQLKVVALFTATLALLFRGGGKASIDSMMYKKD